MFGSLRRTRISLQQGLHSLDNLSDPAQESISLRGQNELIVHLAGVTGWEEAVTSPLLPCSQCLNPTVDTAASFPGYVFVHQALVVQELMCLGCVCLCTNAFHVSSHIAPTACYGLLISFLCSEDN